MSAVLVVILVITAIVVLIFVGRKKCIETSVHSQPHTETHKMSDFGDKETDIYDMPHFSPVREEIITTSCAAYGTNRLN